MASFGVSPDSIPGIEASYAEFLALLGAHLAGSPYLLGGYPTIGDYGLVAPLYAHLARDPYPAQLMKRTAYRVWRWTERMNAADQDAGEYGAPPEDLFEADAVPDTLKALLRFIAEDYLPEVEAFVGFANAWLADHPNVETGTNGLERPGDRAIGQVAFVWRGVPITVGVLPYRLYLLQKIQDVFDEAPLRERAAMEALLTDAGLTSLVTSRATRRVERHGHVEVWT
jgi:hypothetical protein